MDRLITERGGYYNGFTSMDTTSYIETMAPEHLERGVGPGDDEAAGGVLVEAVDEAEARRPAGGAEAQSVEERVHHRGVGGPARRVDHHPGGLVEDDQLAILVQHGERQVLGDRCRRHGRLELHHDGLAAAEPRGRPGRLAGEQDPTAGDETLDARSGEVGREARERHVEA
jgi:hypothetical protein